jgi:hypothetical protein
MEPPGRPNSVPAALQNSMPLASVMDVIAKPPGSAPPAAPYKPAPRLAPLPSRHTLRVRHPARLRADAFGDLAPDNLQARGSAVAPPAATVALLVVCSSAPKPAQCA